MATSTKRTQHYVSRSDGRVYYYKVGHGQPLVMLHNLGLSGWVWRNAIDYLAQHFTCYNIDMPGFDHSDIPPRQYAIGDFASSIVDVMDNIGIEQANVLGVHGGALVALDMAANYPKRVNKIVLDGLPYWNKERGHIVWERFCLPQLTDTTSYNLPVVPFTTWEEAVLQKPYLHRERWEKSEEIKGNSRLWSRLSDDSMYHYDGEAAGSKVNTPTLLVYGEDDVVRRGERRANEGIKESIVEIFLGAPKEAHEHDPLKFARLVVDFIIGSQK